MARRTKSLFSFRKRIKVLPGVTLNLSKSGISSTLGVKGASINVSEKNVYLNTGIPGTGIYSRKRLLSLNSEPNNELEYKMGRSVTLELERLQNLKENGVISEKEFEYAKHKLLYGKEKFSLIKWVCGFIKRSIISTGKLALYITLAFLLFVGFVSFISSDNNTRKVRGNNINLDKECSQASKDGYYAGALYRECFLNLGLPEFEKGLGIIGNYAGIYKQSINCPLGEFEEEEKYRLDVEKAVNKGIQSSESVEKFCQNEKAYFDKIYRKYSFAN